ncbi:MAG: YtfJ family protein [Desulfobacterota bacterium]|nr:YtfJ family protein [Thermodesulfobacteriota bacterium]
MSGLEPGDRAPAFSVYVGARRISYPESFSGKVLVVTYETKDVIEKNRPFKNRMLGFCASPMNASGVAVAFPVIDCSGYIGPIKSYCADQVQKFSKKEQLQLYTDRDGHMRHAFGMKDHESNILIIDQQGIVRYRHAGTITDAEGDRIIELIRQLLKQ